MQPPLPATTEESSPPVVHEPKARPLERLAPVKRFAEGLTRTTPNALELIALVVYSAVIIYVAQFHEPWRDEVRAWSLVRECEHVWEIFPRLRSNEGHPGLWYVLLFFADQIFRTPRVLPWLAAAIAIVAAGLFLWRAPFPRWQKLLFLAGVVPLYEYSVMARNYGIGDAPFVLRVRQLRLTLRARPRVRGIRVPAVERQRLLSSCESGDLRGDLARARGGAPGRPTHRARPAAKLGRAFVDAGGFDCLRAPSKDRRRNQHQAASWAR